MSEEARLHYATLIGAGWTLRSIAAHAGVDATSLSRFARGQEDLPHVIAGVLSVDPATIAERSNHGGSPRVSRVGTVRRLQALMVMGWSAKAIGEHVGKSENWVANKLHQQGLWVLRSTHDLVASAYRDLSHRRGPGFNTRTRALKRGYAGPEAWDDIDHDEAPEIPEAEEVDERDKRIVERERKEENYQWLISQGASHEEALRRVGWTEAAYEKMTERRSGAA